jgi:hypothetical protein
MLRNFNVTTLALACALAASGCASRPAATNDVRVPGISAKFDTTYDHLTPAALKAILQLDIDVTGSQETEQGTFYTLSKAMRDRFPSGTGQVFIHRAAAPPTILTGNWDGPSEVPIVGQSTSEFVDTLFPAIVAIRPSDPALYSEGGTGRILTVTSSSLAAAKSYGLLKTDGSIEMVTSYSALAVNDCARLTRLSGRTDLVLERIDRASCGGTAKN